MPRTRPFDKKTTTRYTLVHRSQHDPLIHDSDAPTRVLAATPGSSRLIGKGKVQTRSVLEPEFGSLDSIRENEGEAAEHGVYYDDSEYDYMQHLRELGGSAENIWIESAIQPQQISQKQNWPKGKLKDQNYDGIGDLGAAGTPWTVRGQHKARAVSYQAQQEIPDEIAGFQPDMDPRLREVLEALEDDAYLDDEDNVFKELAGEEEIDLKEFKSIGIAEEDDAGWESDNTIQPASEINLEGITFAKSSKKPIGMLIPNTNHTAGIAQVDGERLEAFSRSKNGVDELPLDMHITPELETPTLDTSVSLGPSNRNRSGGAFTTSTGFSMTSSVLPRSEALSVLDARFDKLAQTYTEGATSFEEIDDNFSVSALSTSTTESFQNQQFPVAFASPQLVNKNFDSILDEFLNHSQDKRIRKGSKGGKKGIETGMRQLDEIRNELGPAKVTRPKYTFQQV